MAYYCLALNQETTFLEMSDKRMAISRWGMVILMMGGCFLLRVGAEEATLETHLTTAPRVQIPYTAHPPRLDGTDESARWAEAASIENLPPCGADRPIETQVRLLWNEEALYVQFICRDQDQVSPFTGRDADHYLGDVCEVFLDCQGDAQAWMEFQVTPMNQQLDLLSLLTVSPKSTADGMLDQTICTRDLWSFREWNCQDLMTRTSSAEDSWTAEFRIPARAVLRRTGLRAFAPGPLRANLLRYDYRQSETPDQAAFAAWAPVVRGNPHRSPHAMGIWDLMRMP